MTRNLYVGVDLFRLFEADDADALRAVAGDLLAAVRAHPYAARIDALAGEVERAAPAAVCLQEAALVRTRSPSRFDDAADPGATDVEIDLLASLGDRLAARGLDYRVATTVVTNDVEVPAETDDGTVDLRLTDRVAVLVRGDVAAGRSRGDRFAAGVPVPLETVDLTIRRGVAAVDVEVGGTAVAVAATHLEALAAGIRRRQAAELADRLPADRPTVVGGDLNSGPGTDRGAYDRLRAAGFGDAHAARRPDAAGRTCCHDAGLRNASPTLSRRIDALLYRRLRPTAVERVGATPDARVPAGTDDGEVWPSDHAGVVASFAPADGATTSPTSTSTPTASPAASATPAPSVDRDPGSQPGFGAASAVLAAVASLALAVRRRRDGD